MRGRIRQRIGTTLLYFGVSLMLIAGVYEGASFPWVAQFAEWGWIALPTELPDPAPLPVFEDYEIMADAPSAQPLPSAQPEGPSAAPEDPAPTALISPPSQPVVRPKIQLEKLGVIKIPRIQLSENIVAGSDRELYYAVGHVNGSQMPGEKGNCVLAGHRNYARMRPFRHLNRMEIGDAVYVEYGETTYTYEVYQIFEVGPEDVWVMTPRDDEAYVLTLLTCTPIINPTRRLIVWCRLVDPAPQESEAPPEETPPPEETDPADQETGPADGVGLDPSASPPDVSESPAPSDQETAGLPNGQDITDNSDGGDTLPDDGAAPAD